MLDINNIEIVYNDVIRVLKGISFSVPDGTIVSLLGSNGAGKSTVLKAISNILDLEDGKLTEGTITYKNHRLDKMRPEQIVRLGLVQVPEGRGVFSDLTVIENLKAGAFTRKDSSAVKQDIEKVLTYFPVLRDRLNLYAGYLSGGEQQMLVIGRAMMSRFDLLMLDEPSLGLAPMITYEIFRIIKKINKELGVSVLLVEQNANMALNISSYGYIMENGKIVLDGEADKLLENEDVKEFYLGLSEVGQEKSYRDIKHYKRRKRWLS